MITEQLNCFWWHKKSHAAMLRIQKTTSVPNFFNTQISSTFNHDYSDFWETLIAKKLIAVKFNCIKGGNDLKYLLTNEFITYSELKIILVPLPNFTKRILLIDMSNSGQICTNILYIWLAPKTSYLYRL